MYILNSSLAKMAANTWEIIVEDQLVVTSQSKNWSMDEAGNRSTDQTSSDYHPHCLLLSMEWGVSFFAPSAFSAIAFGAPHPWVVCQAKIEHKEQLLDQASFFYVGTTLGELRSAFFFAPLVILAFAVGASLYLPMDSYDGKRAYTCLVDDSNYRPKNN